MVLDIFIVVVFYVMAAFNRKHIPPLPYTNSKDEYMEGGTAKQEPDKYPGKSKIRIAWEILHRHFGAALTACSFWKVDAESILYDIQHPEYDAL